MTIDPDSNIHGFNNELDWFNCYSFGNGVESNRIQDDFNAPFIDKSPIVSSTIKTQYKEDKKTNGLIFSGIINSTSDVNDLNQFIQAEAITKDLNPEYGSIQRLLARDTDLILFCEDKVIRVLANKDAIYNADGNPNLTASNNVLGQTIPYLGEYGVGKNPESISSFGFRIYFADKSRGCVLRLSRDGITEISEKGMSDWFKDNLKLSNNLIGSFDEHKNVYNLTINNYTICFNERVDGWTSFKSFIPEFGLSLNNIYYTFKNGVLYSHNNQLRNNFYGIQYDSSVTTLLNDFPSLIKSFKTLNYEGSLSRLYTYNSDYSSSTNTTGWYANKIASDVQSGSVKEFTEKEGLWTNYVIGDSTTESNVDVKESSVQGIGFYQTGTLSGDINRTQVNITKTLATVDADIVGKITISDSVKLVQNINTTASTTSTFTIKPLTGYLLTHTNFSGSGCTFSQSGSNVICNLTRTYVVVTSDVIDTVNISHNGALTSAGYDLGLTYKTHEENTQSSNRSVLATYSGSYNVQSQLFTITILADIDSDGNFTHEFSTKPSFAIIYSNGESGDTMYTVTDNWSDATSTSVTFTVNYKFGSKNVVGDEILFLCKATKKTQAVGNIITGVNVSTTDLHVTGGSRSIKVTGTPGAKFEIYYYKEKWHVLGNSFINSTGRYIYRETGTYANTWEYNSGHTGYNSLYTFPSSGVKEIPWSSDTDLSIFQGNKVPYKYVFAVRVGQENRNPIPGGEAQPLHYPFTSRSFVQYDASGNIVGDGFPGTNYVNYSVWKDNVRNTNAASASDTATLTFDSIPALIGSNSSWNLKRVSWSGMPGGVNLAVTSTPVLANSIYTVTLKEYKKLFGTSGYAWTDYNVAVPDNTPVTFSDPYDFEIWQRPNGIINLKIQNTDPNITAAISYPTANITAPTAAFATAVVTGRTSSSQSATSSISNSTDLPVSTSTLPLNYAVLSTEIIEEVLIYGSASNVITLSSPQTITSGASVILSERTNALAISNVVKSSNIEVGDIVVSTNVSGGGINKLVKVATVTNQTTLVLDSAIGLYNGMTLAFFKPTAEATYNISSSYANHEPTSASNKYLVNFEAVFQAKNGYQLYENEKLQAEDFKYEKASVVYSGVDTNSGTTLTFGKVTTSTANINGTVSGQNYLDIDNLVGTINVGDSVTGTGVASGVFVTAFSSPTVTFNTNVSLSNDIALTFTNTSKTDLPDSIYAPVGGDYGSSIQYNTYDSSGVATLHTNNVSAINRTTNVITLGTAISAHTVTSGTIFLFNKTTPTGWNFNIKNINGKVDTAAINNKYTISADFEFLKYSENTILSEINIDKLIRVALPVTVVDIVSGDPAPDPIVTEPPAVNQTKKVSFDLIPQNDIISAIALDGNKAIVQSTPQTLRGTGYITAELNGNNFAIGGNSERQPENQITLISIVNASYTFEMYSLALDPNARDTWGTGTATTGLNGLGSSQINFSWSLTLPSVAANDNISVKIGVNKLGSSGTGGFA
jgi:hypothetical protein